MPDEPTLDDYIRILMNDPDPGRRRNAAWILGRQRDLRIITPLIAAAADPDADVRVRVVEALGTLRDQPQVVETLIAALQDADATVRARAAHSLQHAGDRRALASLLACTEDTDATVRAAVMAALGVVGDDAAAAVLLLALIHDDDATVRYGAQESLVALASDEVIQQLIAALKQQAEQPGVLIDLIETLARLRDSRALEPLRALYQHDDGDVRAMAAWAVSLLEHP